MRSGFPRDAVSQGPQSNIRMERTRRGVANGAPLIPCVGQTTYIT